MSRSSMSRLTMIGAAFALLAGCVSAPSGSPPVATPAAARPQPIISGDPVLGQTAATLQSLFGRPALDVREGAARKLQFSGTTCVLDAYLYPGQGRGDPVVTHVDTRLPDGRDTDRNACIAQLRR